jgi:O-antigen/teichoic acid export membrane protein
MSAGAYSVGRFRRAAIQLVGGRVAQAAARVVLVLAVVRILPVEDYGAYMLIVGTAELMLQVGSFGILPLAQRYLPQMLTTLPLRRLYGFVAFLVGVQLAIFATIAGLIGAFWGELTPVFGMSPAQTEATRIAAWMFLVIPAFRFTAELLESMLGFGQIARAVMVMARASAVLLLILLLPVVHLRDVLVVDMAVTGVCVLFVLSRIRRNLRTLHAPEASGTLPVAEMWRFVRHMALVGPMGATSNPGAVRLVLANGLGLAESGLFAFLQTLERLVSRYLPATLLKNLIRPVLISRYVGKGNSDLLSAGTGLLLKSNMLAVIGGLVVIAVCGDQIVAIMSGGKFTGAGLTLLLLYVNMIATSQRGVQEMVMQITGHTRALWITSVVAPVALLLIWAFSGYGLNVAVLIMTAGSLIANWLAAGFLQARTDWFRVDWRGMAAIFIPGLAAALLGLLLTGWARPLLAGALAFMLFVMFVRIGRPFNGGEIGAVERVVGQRAVRLLRGFAVS